MNKIILLGNLTRDPENNNGVVKFTIAVSRNNKEKETDFLKCTAFKTTAEFITKYFKKGNKIAIVGRLQNNNYKDKNGVDRYEYEIIVNEVDFGGNASKTESNTGFTTAPITNIVDEDLPF